MTQDTRLHTAPQAVLLPGLVVAGIGVLLLLHSLNLPFLHTLSRYWPASLIALGFVKLFRP